MKFDVSKEKINSFLSGFNPMEHVIKLEMSYDDDKVKIYYRDENHKRKCQIEPFYPFVLTKQSVARTLFEGNRKTLKDKMSEYGITCKGLIVEDKDGNIPERMANGYRIMFYAQIPMSFSKFMQFFIDGGRPIYPKTNDKNYGLKDYIVVAPNEQHMISNGIRLFKGYDDYDDLLRLLWDLETEGLDPTKDMISQIGIRTNKGFEKLLKVEGEGEEKFKNELIVIKEFFYIIKEIDPDIMSGHNTENFDWNFIDVRLQKHGTSLEEFTSAIFNGHGIYKKNKQSVLKLGGEMEYYYPTIKYGTNITDSLHAVRRAQAIDSSMKKADLKYVTKYSKLNKPNRVYIPGKMINDTWKEHRKIFAFNDNNGEWFKITEKTFSKQITSKEFDTNLFQEVEVVKSRYEYINNNTKLLDNENDITYDIVSGEYIGERYLMDDLYETDKVELRYNQSNFLVGKMLPVSFEKMCTMGTAAIWKYIMLAWSYEHDLAVPELIETRKFVGGLSRLLSVGYVDRIVKLDFNSLYPSIILSYLIQSKIDISGAMNALLEYILTQRETFKDLKGLFSDKIKELKEYIKNNPNCENIEQLKVGIKNVQELDKLIKEYEVEAAKNDKLQLPLKITGNGFFGSYGSGSVFPHSDIECAEKTTCIGRMCLRLMISHFTNLGYKPIVGDTDGFNFQMPKNEEFRYTKEHPYISNLTGRNTKIKFDKKGIKEYEGVEADVAEFEDLYLCPPYTSENNKMGLGIDEYCDATINFARKNYADLLENGKIKLVGNTIKSKKMPIYIEKFLDKGIRLLLDGKGKEFLNYYYDYIEKIYNLQIPLQQIATVGKIKTSIATYKESCKQLTAAGTKKSRQAWYELAIKHNLDVNMGDAIYYINTADKKSASDVKRETKYYYIDDNGEKVDYIKDENGQPLLDRKGNKVDLTKKLDSEWRKFKKDKLEEITRNGKTLTLFEFGKTKYPNLQEEDILTFNCVLLPNEIVEDDEEHFCNDDFEYNKDKYIDMFNKRIRPLLVCFDKNIRTTYNEKGKEIDNILITDPSQRKVFTDNECILVSGQPYNITDQDTYEQLMTIEDKEIRFWLSIDEIPPYVKECGIDWNNVVSEYKERQRQYEEAGISEEVKIYNDTINKFTTTDFNSLIEDGTLPEKLSKIIELDVNTNDFISRKYGVKLGSLTDIIDNFSDEIEEE